MGRDPSLLRHRAVEIQGEFGGGRGGPDGFGFTDPRRRRRGSWRWRHDVAARFGVSHSACVMGGG